MQANPDAIAAKLGKTVEAVRVKMRWLGLEVVVEQKLQGESTSEELLLQGLFSLEEALKILAAALKAAYQPGLSRLEVQRLIGVSLQASITAAT